MRVVFMGTPDFAVEVLKKLVEVHEVVAVVSQPDRAKDRKGRFIFTPVKSFALSKNIPVYQFEKIRNNALELRAFNADIFVTAAYGQILSQEILDIPKYGIINVHASLLPRYRGSSPIQSAILNGDRMTGVTIMQTEAAMDTGDIIMSRSIEIGEMNAGELSKALSELGGDLLLEALDSIESGTNLPKKQDDTLAVACKKFNKDAAELKWECNYYDLYNVIRAFNPNPIAYTWYNGLRLKIYEAEPVESAGIPGQVLCAGKNGLVVACGTGALKINRLQAPGKHVMTDIEFLNGNKITIGEYFGK